MSGWCRFHSFIKMRVCGKLCDSFPQTIPTNEIDRFSRKMDNELFIKTAISDFLNLKNMRIGKGIRIKETFKKIKLKTIFTFFFCKNKTWERTLLYICTKFQGQFLVFWRSKMATFHAIFWDSGFSNMGRFRPLRKCLMVIFHVLDEKLI